MRIHWIKNILFAVFSFTLSTVGFLLLQLDPGYWPILSAITSYLVCCLVDLDMAP